ncbi:MAG: hypothetical protein E7Z82_02215 [Methanobrevibacter sp.]|nr:hypothetical protein [Methanobrevibacter sp.]
MFLPDLVSVIVGLSLLFFGLSAAFMGYSMKQSFDDTTANITIIIGIISAILGFIFIFFIDSLSFLKAIQFYIVGLIMIVFGVTGLISKKNRVSTFTSILVLIMGIIAIALAIFTNNQPIYIAVIIGLVLIIEGISMSLD